MTKSHSVSSNTYGYWQSVSSKSVLSSLEYVEYSSILFLALLYSQLPIACYRVQEHPAEGYIPAGCFFCDTTLSACPTPSHFTPQIPAFASGRSGVLRIPRNICETIRILFKEFALTASIWKKKFTVGFCYSYHIRKSYFHDRPMKRGLEYDRNSV